MAEGTVGTIAPGEFVVWSEPCGCLCGRGGGCVECRQSGMAEGAIGTIATSEYYCKPNVRLKVQIRGDCLMALFGARRGGGGAPRIITWADLVCFCRLGYDHPPGGCFLDGRRWERGLAVCFDTITAWRSVACRQKHGGRGGEGAVGVSNITATRENSCDLVQTRSKDIQSGGGGMFLQDNQGCPG